MELLNFGFFGTDTFDYRIASGGATSAVVRVSITVSPPADRWAKAVSEEYSVFAGQTLSSLEGEEALDTLKARQSFTVGNGVEQLEYSPQYQLLIARSKQAIRVYDAVTGNLVVTQSANNEFSDMDLTSDGRFLFAADHSGYDLYGRPVRPNFVHRYDLANRQWVSRQNLPLKYVEAISSDQYLAQDNGSAVPASVIDFMTNTVVTEIRRHYSDYRSEIEFDAGSGRVFHGAYHWQSPSVFTEVLQNGKLSSSVRTDFARSFDLDLATSTVLSSDGQHFYFGSVQLEAASVQDTRRIFPETIRAATGQVAFGDTGYYDANSGLRLGTWGLSTTVQTVSDDGQDFWLLKGTQAQHFEVRNKPGSLFANDQGLNATTHQAVVVEPPQHGRVVLQADGQFDYTPDADFLGDDQFTYRGGGVFGDSSIGAVTIHVLPRRYVAIDDTLAAVSGQPLSVSLAESLLRNDARPYADSGAAEVVSAPQHGALQLNADGSLTYTPELSFSGVDSFEYRINDAPEFSTPARVTVNVSAPANPPVTLQDHQLGITLAAGSTVTLQEVGGVLQLTVDGESDSFVTGLVGADLELIETIVLNGSAESDRIDLRGFTLQRFPNLRAVTVHGNAGDDSIVGSDVGDVLAGGTGHDTVDGDAGNDTLTAQEGRDEIVCGPGNDLLQAGSDTWLRITTDADVVLADTTLADGSQDVLSGRFAGVTINTNVGPQRIDVSAWTFSGASIASGGGRDTIIGSNGADSVDGGPGDDWLEGSGGGDILLGHVGNDTLLGGAGDDRLFGRDGLDSLDGGAGLDSLGGGLGSDTLADSEDFVWAEQVGSSPNLVLDANGLRGDDADTLIGRISQVMLIGDERDNQLDANQFPWAVSLVGGGGMDSLLQRTGSELHSGATRNDAHVLAPGQTLQVAAADGVLSNDSLPRNGQRQVELATGPLHGQLILQADGAFTYTPDAGWTGLDTFTYQMRAYSQLSDVTTVTLSTEIPRFTVSGDRLEVRLRTASKVQFSDGADYFVTILEFEEGLFFKHPLKNDDGTTIRHLQIVASGGNDRIDLSRFSTNWAPQLSRVTIEGGDGDDTILGCVLGESIVGGAGSDSIESGPGKDTIFGGDGDDEVDSGEGNDSLEAGAGSDTLYGDEGDDTLVGQSGFDILVPSIGKDILRGSSTSIVVVGGDLDWILTNTSVKATFVDGRRRATFSNKLQGSFYGAAIIGGEGDNKYTATGFRFGNVTATGGAGNDTIYGSPGNDFILGEDGNDRIDGGGGHDGLEGAYGNDTLLGSGGDDTLLGGSGADSVNGGAGNDQLGGGLGNDTLTDSKGFVWFEEVADAPDLILNGSGLQGFGTDRVSGRILGVVLIGDERDNRIDVSGYGGAVSINGMEGDDTLIGSSFNDVMLGAEGSDLITGLEGHDVLIGSDGDDLLNGGAGGDTLIGEGGTDVLFGGADADVLLGGNDDDTLNGQSADDTLVGGAGANAFDVVEESNETYSFNVAPLIAVMIPPVPYGLFE